MELIVNMSVLINQLLLLNSCLKHWMKSWLIQKNFLMINMVHHLRIIGHVLEWCLTSNWHEETVCIIEFLWHLAHVVQIQLRSFILLGFLLAVRLISITWWFWLWVIHALIHYLFVNFLSLFWIILIKETRRFWFNSNRASTLTILIIIFLIGIIDTDMLKIKLLPLKILSRFVMNSLSWMRAASIRLRILEIGVGVFVVAFGEAYLL